MKFGIALSNDNDGDTAVSVVFYDDTDTEETAKNKAVVKLLRTTYKSFLKEDLCDEEYVRGVLEDVMYPEDYIFDKVDELSLTELVKIWVGIQYSLGNNFCFVMKDGDCGVSVYDGEVTDYDNQCENCELHSVSPVDFSCSCDANLSEHESCCNKIEGNEHKNANSCPKFSIDRD